MALFSTRKALSLNNNQDIHGSSFNKLLLKVHQPKEHFRRALLLLNTVKQDEKIKNIRNKIRQHAIISLDTLMKGLTSPISNIIKNHKNAHKLLHPFEKCIVDLTIVARVKSGKLSLEVLYTLN